MRLISTCFLFLFATVMCYSPGQAQELPKDKDNGSQLSLVYGKTIDEWIALIPSKDRSMSARAIAAVQLFSPELSERALPALIRELKKHSSSAHLDTTIRTAAVTALGDIIGNLKNPNSTVVRESVIVLARGLQDTQSVVKYRSCISLAKIGPDASPALPYLYTLLRDKSTYETRQAAAYAIGMVAVDLKNGPDNKTLNALYGVIAGDSSSQVRLTAVQALTYLGTPKDANTIQVVTSALVGVALKDPDPSVRLWANMAIMSLSGKADQLRVDQIGKLLEHEDIQIRYQAARVLAALGTDARSQVPRLTNLLDDENKTVAGMAIVALGLMKQWARPALPKLQKIAASKDWSDLHKETAQTSIDQIEGRAIISDPKLK